MATKIILHRKSELVNRTRAVKVLIDGEEKGVITNGSSEEYAVTPGIHRVQCKVSWYASPEFSVGLAEGDTKFLKVRSAMKYFMVAYVLLILVILSDFIIRKTTTAHWEGWLWVKILLLIPFIGYFLYYSIFARKRYLVIEEDKENVFS